MRIFLIGLMGAGKTSVGEKLSILLKKSFLDSDCLLQQRQGQSMTQIFNQGGEAHFRSLESALLAEVTIIPNIVLATGGGSILCPQTRKHLCKRGLVCYLKVSLQQQMLRLQNDNSRPSLVGQQRLHFLHQMQLRRQLFYKSIANISIDTDNKDTEYVAQQLASLIE